MVSRRNLINGPTPGYVLGGLTMHNRRIRKTFLIKKQAREEIGKLSNYELLLIGTSLYWAEGTKENRRNISQRLEFVNSDLKMCQIIIAWLKSCLNVKPEQVEYSVYINLNRKGDVDRFLEFWSRGMRVGKKLIKVYYSRSTDNANRHIRKNYNGQLRIRVLKSTDLNRRVSGLIEGIYEKTKI